MNNKFEQRWIFYHPHSVDVHTHPNVKLISVERLHSFSFVQIEGGGMPNSCLHALLWIVAMTPVNCWERRELLPWRRWIVENVENCCELMNCSFGTVWIRRVLGPRIRLIDTFLGWENGSGRLISPGNSLRWLHYRWITVRGVICSVAALNKSWSL